jgi:starvation-inducible outer membrane lipoprotein
MKKLLLIIAGCTLLCACANLPSDVKDFVNEPGHIDIAVKCVNCHINMTDSI